MPKHVSYAFLDKAVYDNRNFSYHNFTCILACLPDKAENMPFRAIPAYFAHKMALWETVFSLQEKRAQIKQYLPNLYFVLCT